MGELVAGQPALRIQTVVSLPLDMVSILSLLYRAVPGSDLDPWLLDARRRLRVALPYDHAFGLEPAQPLRERARADPAAGVLELGEAARALGKVVHEEGRPLGADDLGARRHRARRVMDGVHGANGRQCNYPNGSGHAGSFGIRTRAIAENGDGLHAWQMPTSQATERKTNASSIAKPH